MRYKWNKQKNICNGYKMKQCRRNPTPSSSALALQSVEYFKYKSDVRVLCLYCSIQNLAKTKTWVQSIGEQRWVPLSKVRTSFDSATVQRVLWDSVFYIIAITIYYWLNIIWCWLCEVSAFVHLSIIMRLNNCLLHLLACLCVCDKNWVTWCDLHVAKL